MSLKEYGFKEIIDHMWEKRERYKIKNLRELIDCLKDSFSYVGDILDREISGFKIYIILNKIRSSQDIFIGSSIKSILLKYLGINAKFVGYIEYDDSIWRSVRERRPFMLTYSLSRSAKEIEAFTENLIQGKEMRLMRS